MKIIQSIFIEKMVISYDELIFEFDKPNKITVLQFLNNH